ncbi:MAG: Rha family transcriptional regulator [Duncaniella sp.]|nr:Rha family transcriptional regulator [Duncaniella sp.]
MPNSNESKVAVNNSTRVFASSHETANLVSIQNNQAVTTSLKVAEVFGKSHKEVLRAIRTLECSTDFIGRNFAPYHYVSELNEYVSRKLPMYYLTRDGFTFLAMGFTGKVAAKFKEDYIIAFNEMEALLHSEECTKVANKMLGDEVKRLNKRLRSAVREGQVKYGKYYGPYGDIQVGLFHSDKLSFRDNLTNLCGMVHSAFLDGYFVAKEMRESKGLLSQFREFLSRIY